MVTLDAAGVAPFLFEAYDPYAVMQDEQSIWDLAVASPHEASTMICAATFRTPDQQVHCDATTDARRQVFQKPSISAPSCIPWLSHVVLWPPPKAGTLQFLPWQSLAASFA